MHGSILQPDGGATGIRPYCPFYKHVGTQAVVRCCDVLHQETVLRLVSMAIIPGIGSHGGQQYDIVRAIQTFLGQMAEGGIGVAAAVIKELLQNADDAGATEVSVILDERPPPPDFPSDYRPLLVPAILVRNNRPFKLKKEVAEGDTDDFTAICDVASGHKRAQATAAGRFGIGFNSVYFLTDTPVLFSRREVHVFDLLHLVSRVMVGGFRW